MTKRTFRSLTVFALSALLTLAASGPAARAAESATRLRYLDAKGTVLMAFEVKDGAVEATGLNGAKLGKLKLLGDRVKLRDASDVERLKVKRKDNGSEVEDGSGNRLYRIKEKGDGKLVLDDAGGTTLATVRADGSGAEVRRDSGEVLAKVKASGGKVTFEGANGDKLGELEGASDTRAAAWLVIEKLSLAERAALWAFYAKVAP